MVSHGCKVEALKLNSNVNPRTGNLVRFKWVYEAGKVEQRSRQQFYRYNSHIVYKVYIDHMKWWVGIL